MLRCINFFTVILIIRKMTCNFEWHDDKKLLEIFEFWIVIGIYENGWEVVGSSLPFSNFIFFFIFLYFILMSQFSPILILLFKYSRKFKGVRKILGWREFHDLCKYPDTSSLKMKIDVSWPRSRRYWLKISSLSASIFDP